MQQQRFFVGLCVIAAMIAAIAVPLISRRGDDLNFDRASLRWEATLLVPVNDNAGTPFPKDVWEKALAELVNNFGGATVHEQKDGYWKGPNGIVPEPVRPVVVTFANGDIKTFRAALQNMGTILGQSEMYAQLERCHVERVVVHSAKAEK